jgi:hypothetical protein
MGIADAASLCRRGLVALLALLLLLPATARGDILRILGWKDARKGRATVLLYRQVLDYSKGFDQFFFEEYEAPANQRKGRTEVAPKARRTWLPMGHFEVYMDAVGKARKRLFDTYLKKGYEPACDLLLETAARSEQLTFEAGGKELTLRLVRGSRHDEVLLERDDRHSYSLMRFTAPAGRDAPQVGGRALLQASLLRGGRMLAVVVRTHYLPSPQHAPQDDVYFYPLSRAAKQLGIAYPLKPAACSEKDDPWS